MRVLTLLMGLFFMAQAQACGPYRFAFVVYPGLFERDAQGREFGLDVDLLQAMRERSGCKFEVQVANPARIWPAMARGEIDVAASSLRTPEREEQVEFLIFARSRVHLLLSRAQAQATPSLAAFTADVGLRLGVVRGGAYAAAVQPWVDRLRSQGRVSESADKASLLRAFRVGRVQAVLAFPMELYGSSAAFEDSEVLKDWWPEHSAVGGWALSRARVSAADRERLRQAARSLLQDGTVERLAERTLGPALARSYVITR
jgi:polar amino acid transport system substrate-binding protein